MCGIVGVAGDLTKADVQIFEDLLDVVQLRGRHSTGAVKVHRHRDEYDWVKRVGPPAYLKDSIEYREKINGGALPRVLLGHGRHKTVGEIDVASAHPFDFPEKKLIGVHNGTLKNYWRFSEHSAGQVDSYTLYKRLVNIGAQKLFEDLEGAWCCVWWDGETEELCFIRNKERPLVIAYSKDRRKMFWASETWMLGAVYRREDLWENPANNDSPYHNLETDTLYRVKISPNAQKNSPVFQVTEGKKIVKKPVTVQRNNYISNQTGSASGSGNNNKGGEVTSPFLDDELPEYLTQPASQKQFGTATKPSNTQKNSNNSTPLSKTSQEQTRPLQNTWSGVKSMLSPTSQGSSSSQKTKREKLSVVAGPALESGSENAPSELKIYQANTGTDTRYIKAVDTEYITDRRTGREVDETTFHNETGGCCFHCGTKITSLIEVAEIFDKGSRFICNSCVRPEFTVSVPSVKKGN